MSGNITSDNSDIEMAALLTFTGLSARGFAVGINFLDGQPDWVHLAYPIEWQREYVDRDLLHEDATVMFASSYTGHITWANLRKMFPDNPAMLAAEKHGLTVGNTVAIHQGGLRSVASAAGPEWSPTQVKQATAALLALHELHAVTAPPPTPAALVDVVRLMASGLRDAEIAEQLHIEVPTVRKRRTKAQKMTETKTPAELVAHAIRAGWF